jgi:Fe-S cluster biogenesis protein NfuA
MAVTTQDKKFTSLMQTLDQLLAQVQSISDPASRDVASRIVQSILEFHGAGLEKILDRISEAGELGQSIIDDLGQDELASGLLLLYGLHPLDLETRVRNALESVRPYLRSHGGNVELLGISPEAVVRLQMRGSCHGCPSSAVTLKNSIEQAIYEKAPDVTTIEVENVDPPPKPDHDGFVSIESLMAATAKHSSQGEYHAT